MTDCPIPHDAAPAADPAALPLPPGSTGLPFLGETLAFVQDSARFVTERRARYGDTFQTHLFGSPTILMMGAEANLWIFSGENKYLETHWSPAVRRLLGENAMSIITGEAHRERRRLLAPHFRYGAVEALLPQLEAITRRHLAAWAEEPDYVTLFEAVRRFAFEVALTLILGDTPVDQAYLSQQFRTWVASLFAPVPVDLPFTLFGRAVRAGEALRDTLRPIVRERRTRAEQPDDILGSLLTVRDEAGQPLPEEVIIDELRLFLFAGHDTTVTAASNLMLLLAQHPAVIERARAEQAAYEWDQPIGLDELRAMPYLHQVIHEGLRLIPPIGGAFRRMTEDTRFGDYLIPKGWTVMWGARATHYGENWDHPDRFDPDRFGPERAEHKRAPFQFVPFGGGPRVCIGQNFAMIEMALFFALLFRHYDWSLVPDQDLTYSFIPLPRPKSGIQVYVNARA